MAKPHTEQLHAYSWSFFEVVIQEKQVLFFSFMVVIAIRSSTSMLGYIYILSIFHKTLLTLHQILYYGPACSADLLKAKWWIRSSPTNS